MSGERLFRAHITWKDTLTGQTGTYTDSEPGSLWWSEDLQIPGVDTFMWAEGNYSCDCNRKLFFLGWENEDEDLTCGSSRFVITSMSAIDSDGAVLLVDYSESLPTISIDNPEGKD